MDWRLLLLLLVLVNYVIKPALNKKIVDRPSRTRSLLAMYVACFVFALGCFMIMGFPLIAPELMLLIAGIGVLNSFACYCHWRALAISQSGTSVLAQSDDLVAIILGYAFLGETRYLNNPLLTIGIGLSLGSAFLLAFIKRSKAEEKTVSFRSLLGWVLGYCFIWGGAMFSYRAFALNGVEMPSYVFCWYGGSVIGAFAIRHAMGKKEAGASLTLRQAGGAMVLGAMSWGALMLFYLTSSRAPVTVTQPAVQASEVVFPAIIGLWFFKEREHFSSWKSRVLFGTAFIGGILSAVSYG